MASDCANLQHASEHTLEVSAASVLFQIPRKYLRIPAEADQHSWVIAITIPA
jgi:hypothetical protein